MLRSYLLHVTSNALLASPYTQLYWRRFYDLTLHLREPQTVHFLLQVALSEEEQEDLQLVYDPIAVTASELEIETYQHQTMVSVTLLPKELGSIEISFMLPYSVSEPAATKAKLDYAPVQHTPALA